MSGPTDVVLVVNGSGSMEDYAVIDLTKDVATTIVDTITVGDRVNIVAFSDRTTQIGGFDSLVCATSENKKRLVRPSTI